MLFSLMVVIKLKNRKCFKIQEDAFMASKLSPVVQQRQYKPSSFLQGPTAKVKCVPFFREDLSNI